MSFSELHISEIHIIFGNTALSMHTREKKKSILDKRAIFIQIEKKKVPNTTQYPAKHDL